MPLPSFRVACQGEDRRVKCDDDVETIVFVDIDGVLNVGLRDNSGSSPVSFSEANVALAQEWNSKGAMRGANPIAECLLDIYHRKHAPMMEPFDDAEHEGYSRLASDKDTGLSEVLVQRFAGILRACGSRRTVVLSSTWRMPKYEANIRRLEEMTSRCLGYEFEFGSRTPLRKESNALDRIVTIGDFLEDHHRAEDASAPLRVLVLDDFCAGPVACVGGAMRIRGVGDVEQYLLGRAPKWANMSVKVVHTYDEWETESGLLVRIGAGLTPKYVHQAYSYLNKAQFSGGAHVSCGIQAQQDHSHSSTIPGGFVSSAAQYGIKAL